MIDCPNHTSAPAGGLAIPPCPLDISRPEILAALTQGRNLVLSALPGAGKSSRVPLWLMDQPWLEGRRILLLEPRRVAARALARYMAALLGEQPGGLVGYRMRDESRMGSNYPCGSCNRRRADPHVAGIPRPARHCLHYF